MDLAALFEPGTHSFNGTVKSWRNGFAEVITDSGISIPLVAEGQTPMAEGTRITITARKYRPLYQMLEVKQR